MEGAKTLFCCVEFSWESVRISSKFMGNLGTRAQKFRQPWTRSFTLCSWLSVSFP